MPKFEISITNNQEIFPVNIDEIKKSAALILEYAVESLKILDDSCLRDYDIEDKTISIDILLTDNEEIEELNSSYRGLDKPTDVLAFALFADNPDLEAIPEDEIPLGEVVISIETAKLQADNNDIPLIEEIYFLLAHGILHLMGYDHPDDESLEMLMEIQAEILASIR
jgi:rRNA maturation RNase YbeY